jgi:hypothetical protein
VVAQGERKQQLKAAAIHACETAAVSGRSAVDIMAAATGEPRVRCHGYVTSSPAYRPGLEVDRILARQKAEAAAEAERCALAAVNEPIVYVRRHWSDYLIGTVRLSSLDGLHMDTKSGGYEGGFGVVASRPFLHGYILCTDVVTGAVGHSCRHGPPPHRIKICITQVDNDRRLYAELRRKVEPNWRKRNRATAT